MEVHRETERVVQAVEAARRDIRHRTLDKIRVPLERLVYLASLRDYRSGKYFHDGLAMQFSEPIAAAALRLEHVETFRAVAFTSLRGMVEQVDGFLRSGTTERIDSLKTWKSLEPYSVLVPVAEDRLAVQFFRSNIKFALTVLLAQQEHPLQ